MTIHKASIGVVAYIHGGSIYIPHAYAYPSVVSHLAMVCHGNANTGLCLSYQVPDDLPGHKPMQELMAYLEGYGFRIEKVGAGNAAKVWT